MLREHTRRPPTPLSVIQVASPWPRLPRPHGTPFLHSVFARRFCLPVSSAVAEWHDAVACLSSSRGGHEVVTRRSRGGHAEVTRTFPLRPSQTKMSGSRDGRPTPSHCGTSPFSAPFFHACSWVLIKNCSSQRHLINGHFEQTCSAPRSAFLCLADYFQVDMLGVQGYLAHKKHPPP